MTENAVTDPVVPRLKLIVMYDANHNEYSVLTHNQRAEEAKTFVNLWNPRIVSGCSMITLDQSRLHQEPDAQNCRACRETVVRTANINPQPKFKRRNT